MTTIAFDGRLVAADSRAIAGDYIMPMDVEKLRLGNGGRTLFGSSGYHAFAEPWINWYLAGCDPKNPPANTLDDGSGNFIVFFKDISGVIFASTYGLKIPHPVAICAPDAWGSGSSFAIGAMKQGASATEAVAIAIECDPYSGGRIMTFDMHEMVFI